MPAVSVIIPTRDRASLIGFAIESLKQQIFTDWECWIIDDGSTDQSEHVIPKLIGSDSRFKYVKRPPLGISAARNYAVDCARGKYICLLDSDDGYQPNGIGQLYHAIKCRPEIQLIYANYEVHDLITGECRQFNTVPAPSKPELYKCFIKPRANPILPSASIVRTAAFREVGRFDAFFETSETVEFWGRFVERFDISHLDVSTSIYRRHDHQVTRQLVKRLFYYDELGLRAVRRLTTEVLFPGENPGVIADKIERFAKDLYRSPFPILRTCLELISIAQQLHFCQRRQRLMQLAAKRGRLIVEGRLGVSANELGAEYFQF